MTIDKLIKLAASLKGWRLMDSNRKGDIRRFADYGFGKRKFRECPITAVANALAAKDNGSVFAIGQEKLASKYLGLNKVQCGRIMDAADNQGAQALRAKMLKAFKLEK